MDKAMMITNEAEARRAFLKAADLSNKILFTSNAVEMHAIEDELEEVEAALEAYLESK